MDTSHKPIRILPKTFTKSIKLTFFVLITLSFNQKSFSQNLRKVNNQLKIELNQKKMLFDSLNNTIATKQQKNDMLCNEISDTHFDALLKEEINNQLFEFIKINTEILSNYYDIEFDNSNTLKNIMYLKSLYPISKRNLEDSLFRRKFNQINIDYNFSNNDKLRAKIENKILLKKSIEFDSLINIQRNKINCIDTIIKKLEINLLFFNNLLTEHKKLNTLLNQQIDNSAKIGINASEIKKKEIEKRIKEIKNNNKKTKIKKDKIVICPTPVNIDYDFTSELITTTNKTYSDGLNKIKSRYLYLDPQIENSPSPGIDEAPQFPGGEKELMKFIYCNLKLNENQLNEEKVIVIFVIEKNGQLVDIKINKNISETLDNEALRIVKLMPNWIPGKSNGQIVKTRYNLPIVFSKEKIDLYCR